MKRISLGFCLLAFCFSACADNAQKVSARLVKDELVRLSGASAVNCGLVFLGHSTEQAWACVLAAEKSKRPFWMAIQEHGIDSIPWIAIGRDEHGTPYVVTYDSSPYGAPGLHPRFTRDICPSDTRFDPKARLFGCSGTAP